MADFPVKKDFRKRRVTMPVSVQGKHELRPVKKASNSASTNDFQVLLAGIQKLEKRTAFRIQAIEFRWTTSRKYRYQ